MYVKIMGPEDAPDDDVRKTYRLLQQVVGVNFGRDRICDHTKPENHSGAVVYLTFEDGHVEAFNVDGNVYVMNDQGRTVASFGSCPIGDAESGRGRYPTSNHSQPEQARRQRRV